MKMEWIEGVKEKITRLKERRVERCRTWEDFETLDLEISNITYGIEQEILSDRSLKTNMGFFGLMLRLNNTRSHNFGRELNPRKRKKLLLEALQIIEEYLDVNFLEG